MALRFVLIAVCCALASPGFAQDRIEVVTTTTDLRSLTEAVGGERVAAILADYRMQHMNGIDFLRYTVSGSSPQKGH